MKIEVTQASGKKEIFSFSNEGFITVGRSKKCDICLEGEAVSRDHLHIYFKEGEIVIEDQGSTNGVFKDEQKIPAFEPVEFSTLFPVKVGENSFLSLLSIEEEEPITRNKSITLELSPVRLELDYNAYKIKHRKVPSRPVAININPLKGYLLPLTVIVLGLVVWYLKFY